MLVIVLVDQKGWIATMQRDKLMSTEKLVAAIEELLTPAKR